MYQIIQKRKIWLSISGFLVLASIIALGIWGLNFGIDFTGGSLLEVKFRDDRPSVVDVNTKLGDMDLGSLIVQPVDEQGMILRFQEIDEEKHQEVLTRLNELVSSEDDVVIETEIATSTDDMASSTDGIEILTTKVNDSYVEELRFDSVGPTIGAELKSKSVTAIVVVLVAIILYIAWAFRAVSKPVASWKYGLAAIVALFHDVMITLGVFSILGYLYEVEITTAFVAAILTVLGYSVNDTIVVFDRVRENLPKSSDDFEGTVNTSVNQTIKRSVNTSLTTLLVLLSILFFGGTSIRDFVLALSIGVFVGTYSSIFLASPVLVLWEKLGRK
ncbi:protein translocase subunit SecF [Candidatus Parcubacteria bacterium]|nr:MAG: protein translocase subunit SecF [Candidatus Parcubacteria bacterium]